MEMKYNIMNKSTWEIPVVGKQNDSFNYSDTLSGILQTAQV